IVADDFSTDRTPAIVRRVGQSHRNLRLLQMEELLGGKQLNSYKKKAIELAINESKGEWIVTTDADCIVPIDWLMNLASFIQVNDSVFVAAPVKVIDTGTFVSRFQCLDFMSLH